jgi:hypothetical protein
VHENRIINPFLNCSIKGKGDEGNRGLDLIKVHYTLVGKCHNEIFAFANKNNENKRTAQSKYRNK